MLDETKLKWPLLLLWHVLSPMFFNGVRCSGVSLEQLQSVNVWAAYSVFPCCSWAERNPLCSTVLTVGGL